MLWFKIPNHSFGYVLHQYAAIIHFFRQRAQFRMAKKNLPPSTQRFCTKDTMYMNTNLRTQMTQITQINAD